MPQVLNIKLFDFSDPKIRTLHLTWFAFFLTFAIWFSHAPLLAHIKAAFALSDQQIKALMIINVALTIPARILVGMLVDRFGPRRVYAGLLFLGALVCFAFASAQTYQQLALTRFLLGFIGAGFVIGIRLVGEWFPAHQVGIAEGIYGGWGNFGSAAAAMLLPSLALVYGGDNGWRYAIASIGVVALIYAAVFYHFIRNTPKGSTYFKPKRNGGMEVSSWRDLWLLLLMNVPMYLALAVLSWKLSPAGVHLISQNLCEILWGILVVLFAVQTHQIWHVNVEHLRQGVSDLDKYHFSQVAILNLSYFITFGSELAVVSMLPLFFLQTFTGLNPVIAGFLASGFAFMNIVARPGGGWFSDKFGRRGSLMVLIGGLALGYFILSHVSAGWPVWLAVVATMFCSFFVQAGEGAVFAIVPLIKRRLTGQIAGMTGAYGNVGGVTYLTVLSFVDFSHFFLIIAISAILGLVACYFLRDPRGHITEVDDEGNVHQIQVGANH